MYFEVIQQCAASLKNLDRFLDKAIHFARAKGMDTIALMEARLAPDMKAFVYQVQSACDYMKGGAAWLSGQTPPKHADNERTIDEVRARIKKTLDFVESVPKEKFEGAADRKVTLSWKPGRAIPGETYLLQVVVPNLYFHIAMAYAILRNQGVDVGKMDFLGEIYSVEA